MLDTQPAAGLPMKIVLVQVERLAPANCPIAMLKRPLVRFWSAPAPKAELAAPVLALSANEPKAELLTPVVLAWRASEPKAELLSPVLAWRAVWPKTEVLKPVVLSASAWEPKAEVPKLAVL